MVNAVVRGAVVNDLWVQVPSRAKKLIELNLFEQVVNIVNKLVYAALV